MLCLIVLTPIKYIRTSITKIKYFRVLPWRLFRMQVKLESLLYEIVSDLENKELLISFRVYGKSLITTQTDGDG